MNSDLTPNFGVKTKPVGAMAASNPVECSGTERAGIHDCKVVRIEPPNIVTHWSDERDHIHFVELDAVIIVDGHASSLANVRPGSPVRLTTKSGDPLSVSRIESSSGLGRTSGFVPKKGN